MVPGTCPDGLVVFATDFSLSLSTAKGWIPAGACKKVASDLRLGGGFQEYFGFLHHVQLAIRDLA